MSSFCHAPPGGARPASYVTLATRIPSSIRYFRLACNNFLASDLLMTSSEKTAAAEECPALIVLTLLVVSFIATFAVLLLLSFWCCFTRNSTTRKATQTRMTVTSAKAWMDLLRCCVHDTDQARRRAAGQRVAPDGRPVHVRVDEDDDAMDNMKLPEFQ
jgi:hypothetical protein